MPALRVGRWGWGVLGLLAVLSGTMSAEADNLRFRYLMPYAEARETFRRLGYEPYFMPGADICDSDDPRCYPELESCAKSRSFSCIYTWRRGRAIIEVETRYQQPVMARSECIINCTAAALRGRRGGRTAAATAVRSSSKPD